MNDKVKEQDTISDIFDDITDDDFSEIGSIENSAGNAFDLNENTEGLPDEDLFRPEESEAMSSESDFSPGFQPVDEEDEIQEDQEQNPAIFAGMSSFEDDADLQDGEAGV